MTDVNKEKKQEFSLKINKRSSQSQIKTQSSSGQETNSFNVGPGHNGTLLNGFGHLKKINLPETDLHFVKDEHILCYTC